MNNGDVLGSLRKKRRESISEAMSNAEMRDFISHMDKYFDGKPMNTEMEKSAEKGGFDTSHYYTNKGFGKNYMVKDPSFIPKCPFCGASRVQKIPLTYKAGALVLFGALSAGYITKKYKCSNCGSKW